MSQTQGRVTKAQQEAARNQTLNFRELTESEKNYAWRMTQLIRELEMDFVNISHECVDELSKKHKLLPSLVIQVARNLGIGPGPKHRRNGL